MWPNERVQAFTHPLWVFLITPIYAMTGEVYFAVIRISLVLSMVALVLFAYKIARSIGAAILGILALSFSAAFVDFSTSGLENPLTFLILAIFLYIYFTNKHDLRTLTLLCLIASIGAVNRLDTILLFLPMLVYVFWINRGGKAIIVALIGFIPLIAWEVFSLIYYGFPFPNTAYAKLNTGIARPDLWQHGIWYILYSLRTDPITVIMILSGIIMPLITRSRRMAAPAIGIILYIIYVINIGGCFMADGCDIIVAISKNPNICWRYMAVDYSILGINAE
jgi:arabinofuranosyltransferase